MCSKCSQLNRLRQAPGVAPIGGLPAQQPSVTTTTLPAVAPAPQQPVVPAPAIPAPAKPALAPVVDSSISSVLSATTTTILLDAIAPAAPPASVTAIPFSNVPFVTVVWEETFIGGTYSTWVPYTVSLDFKPSKIHPPLPGKGEIGMGTLTGNTGHTQTVVVGAAPTQGAVWVRGIAAAVGAGIAGIVV